MSLLEKVRTKVSRKERWRRKELQASKREYLDLVAARTPDQMVCGTVRPDGRPTYFLAPRDAPDDVLEGRAFKARNGRDRLPGEVALAKMAAQHTARVAS
jgi:hypothetical protein